MVTQDRIRRGAWPVFVLAAVLAVAGCGESQKDTNHPITPPSEQTPDLNVPNGGFTAESEEPGFGDAALVASALEETAVEDPVERDQDVQGWMARPGADVYVLSAVWGMLESSDDPTAPPGDGQELDWSGKIECGRAAILLRSVISFERADGDSMLPRSSRHLLEWVSRTGAGHDGLRFLIVRPPSSTSGPERSTAATDSVYFRAGSYSRVITWQELAILDDEVQIDASGNRISLQAHRVEPSASHLGGFLRGQWDPIPAGESEGSFRGVWVGARGLAVGLFHGIYGTNDAGEQVFYGKYIDEGGAFLGILRGTWGAAGREPRNDAAAVELGWFRGEWVNADGDRQGELNGRYRTPEDRPGFLRGRWCRGDCLNQP